MVPAAESASLQSSASSYPSNRRQGRWDGIHHFKKHYAGPKIMHAPRACRAHYRTQAAALSNMLHSHCMFSLRLAFGMLQFTSPRNRPTPTHTSKQQLNGSIPQVALF